MRKQGGREINETLYACANVKLLHWSVRKSVCVGGKQLYVPEEGEHETLWDVEKERKKDRQLEEETPAVGLQAPDVRR